LRKIPAVKQHLEIAGHAWKNLPGLQSQQFQEIGVIA
jgi:hypothetical protein